MPNELNFFQEHCKENTSITGPLNFRLIYMHIYQELMMSNLCFTHYLQM